MLIYIYIDIQLLLSIGLICQLNISVTACLSLTMVALFLRGCPKNNRAILSPNETQVLELLSLKAHGEIRGEWDQSSVLL